MIKRIGFLLSIIPSLLVAQTPVVPSHIQFADLNLKITEGARKEIQEDVDMLTQSPKYFKIKIDRADFYFPSIEKILASEKVPDDFKFLALQESALISDAVSSSNAIGFWQFKKAAASEVGLRMDSKVDERLNIVSSTRGAANYLKYLNSYFDNWLYALMSYNTGAGGAQKYVQKKNFGARKMEVNKKTHWYVKRYLAHKIAFEDKVGKNKRPEKTLVEYKRGANKSLRSISRETSIKLDELEEYNKWLKKGDVPGDKAYAVILPVSNGKVRDYVALTNAEKPKVRPEVVADDRKAGGFPVIGPSLRKYGDPGIKKINGIPGIVAREGDQINTLAGRSGISAAQFRNYNDMNEGQGIESGQVYYFKKKKNKAGLYYHTALWGESLWSISQKFGLKLKKLRQKNRMNNNDDLQPGRVLWVRNIRPSDNPVEFRKEIAKPPQPKQTATVPEPSDPGIEEVEIKTKPLLASEEKDNPATIAEVEELPAGPDPKSHVVKPGESLFGISRAYQVELDEILELNSLTLTDTIHIDQVIFIPDLAPEMKEVLSHRRMMHEVKTGDTLYQISKEYQVEVEQLMEWNGKKDHHLFIGEKLWVDTPDE